MRREDLLSKRRSSKLLKRRNISHVLLSSQLHWRLWLVKEPFWSLIKKQQQHAYKTVWDLEGPAFNLKKKQNKFLYGKLSIKLFFLLLLGCPQKSSYCTKWSRILLLSLKYLMKTLLLTFRAKIKLEDKRSCSGTEKGKKGLIWKWRCFQYPWGEWHHK